MIEAKVICDSISPSGVRLMTMELNYHRFIHAEAKTHRILSLDDEEYEIVLKQDVDLMDDPMLSRNASSSRAIPTTKMLEQIRSNPAMPVHWGKNQAGMQAREELPRQWVLHPHNGEEEQFEGYWQESAISAAQCAEGLAEIGMHKQIVNRLTEPFQYIKVIVTATEWDSFFKLRLHKDAQPEMMVLAEHMKKAMDESIPTELHPGEWHLPYLSNDELGIANPDECLEEAIKWSVARCARVSYLNHDKSFPDRDKDIALADMLLAAGHMSPLEHQLTPMEAPKDDYNFEKGVTHIDRDGWKWSGNSRAWYQHRQLIGEI